MTLHCSSSVSSSLSSSSGVSSDHPPCTVFNTNFSCETVMEAVVASSQRPHDSEVLRMLYVMYTGVGNDELKSRLINLINKENIRVTW